jgi:hypothetical protein
MSKVPVSASREHLEAVLRQSMPKYRSQRSIDSWNTEKEIAVAEWNKDLPGVASTHVSGCKSCAGGPLITTPVSTAKPIPLDTGPPPEQTSFL